MDFLYSKVYHLNSKVYHLNFKVYHLNFKVYHLNFKVYTLKSKKEAFSKPKLFIFWKKPSFRGFKTLIEEFESERLVVLPAINYKITSKNDSR